MSRGPSFSHRSLRVRAISLFVSLGLTLAACTSTAPGTAEGAPSAPAPSRPAAPLAASAPAPSSPAAPSPRVRFERASEGDLEAQVRDLVTRARAEGRAPLVYVGATWCEPCQYFHGAAERGELDADLPPLLLLELDLDRDRERVAAAGYGSRMIPLFAVPGLDGRGTGRQIEGSIHGPGSPREIAPRLRELLAAPR